MVLILLSLKFRSFPKWKKTAIPNRTAFSWAKRFREGKGKNRPGYFSFRRFLKPQKSWSLGKSQGANIQKYLEGIRVIDLTAWGWTLCQFNPGRHGPMEYFER